jgi:hypothetical protein
MPTKITGPDGKEYKAVDVKFTTQREEQSIYDTEIGVTVRLKTAVVRILVAVDEHGQPVRLPNGEPMVVVQSQNLATAELRD